MKLFRFFFSCGLALIGLASASAQPMNLPWVDISGQKDRQIVIAEGTETLYNGHPTTVLMPDNKTMLCVWTEGHGGQVKFLSRSEDAGLTWKSLDVPADWAQTYNCPCMYRLVDKKGVERLMIFSSVPGLSQTYSEDGGKTWSPVRSLKKPCVMPFTSVIRLKNGDYLAMYHRGLNDRDRSPLKLWQCISKDGGLTWEESVMVGAVEGRSPCEPCVFRTPDGNRLICIARENDRKGHSLMMVSNDEGQTWSKMVETPWGLTGDRHMVQFTPDGRLVAVFRDMAPGSPTKGHFVAWVGTCQDILQGYSGQYRIKLLHNYKSWDCGYPGLEILPDGTLIATTYVKYRPGKERNSVVSVRFRLDETDKLLR